MKYHHMSFEQLARSHKVTRLLAVLASSVFVVLMLLAAAGVTIHMSWAMLSLFFALLFCMGVFAEYILLQLKMWTGE